MPLPATPPATIRDYLNRHLKCELTVADALPFATVLAVFAKDEVITALGQTECHGYYLREGIVQVSLGGAGGAKIVDFFLPGEFFAAYTSFLTQQPADVELTALMPCAVEQFTQVDLAKAYETSLLANQLGRTVTEQLYLRKVKREKDFLNRTVEERYLDLLAQKPTLFEYLPVEKIARYLGVHPNSLSRIRRKV